MIHRIKQLDKGEFKSKLSFLVLHYDPELTIHEKDWDRVYYFYIGYVSCFKTMINYPFEDSYAHNFILEECFKYLLELIK